MISERAAFGGLAVLTVVNLLNYLDRYLVPALVPDLEHAHMGLTDLRLGTLMTGFIIVYMLAAPLFGTLGDRRSRTRSIAAGVAIWSLATALSGLARNYAQLLMSRAAVGIGEAAYGTIAPSLLADYFPRARRGRVFAVFNMAIPVGAALGYIVGGLISVRYGWRAAFLIGGVPGLILAALVFRLAEPQRGVQDQPAPPPPARAAAPAVAVYLSLLKRRTYLITVLGYAAYTFALGGLAFWMPDFLERARGVSAAQATTGFGAIVLVTGFLGTFGGGWVADWWLRRTRGANLWLSGITALAAVPLALLALTATSPPVFYAAIVAAELMLFASTGPVNSEIVNLVAPTERASAVALSVLTIHLLGDVISPPLIGLISERSSLATAVLIVPVAIAACAALWLAAARAVEQGAAQAA